MRDYTIAEYKDLSNLIDSNGGVFVEKLAFNQADLYQLSDDSIVLLPESGSTGIWFHKDATFKKMIEEEYFPVTEGFEGPLVAERERIQHLEVNIAYFVRKLSELLKIQLFDNNEIIYNYEVLNQISDTLIQINNKEELFSKVLVPLTVYTGEYIRKQTNTYWKVEKIYYSLNAHWDFDLWAKDGFLNVGIITAINREIFSPKTDLTQVVKKEISAYDRYCERKVLMQKYKDRNWFRKIISHFI